MGILIQVGNPGWERERSPDLDPVDCTAVRDLVPKLSVHDQAAPQSFEHSAFDFYGFESGQKQP